MTRMGSDGPGRGAGSAPAGPRRRAARWCAVGVSVAAVAGTGLVGASAALASPTVTIPVGCSVTALNHAINFAPSNANLVLRSGCHYHPTSALAAIHENLTIQGSNDTIEPSTGAFTVLTNDGADVGINQLTIRDADANSGGGAINNVSGGQLTVTNSNFIANDGKTGGAINNEVGSALTVSNTAFVGNYASGAGGGAIANGILATTTVNGDTFLDNHTAGYGGAIDSLGGTVTVTGSDTSLFTGNSASVDGGAIAGILGAFNVTKATFTDNFASDFGGAIANFGAPSVVATSSFTHNAADEDGGAIATASTLDLASDYISLNFAGAHGGGLDLAGGNTSLTTTDIVGNASSLSGGGIFRSSGTLNLNYNSLVTLNHPNNCTGVSC